MTTDNSSSRFNFCNENYICSPSSVDKLHWLHGQHRGNHVISVMTSATHFHQTLTTAAHEDQTTLNHTTQTDVNHTTTHSKLTTNQSRITKVWTMLVSPPPNRSDTLSLS